MSIKAEIGFIGGGNMAKAIVDGALKKGVFKVSQLMVSTPSRSTEYWKNLSIRTTHDNGDVIRACDIIIFAFKPQQLDVALRDISFRDSLPSKLYVSILAGISNDALYSAITLNIQPNPRVVRVMPNTLVMVCEGCSAIAGHSSATTEDIRSIREIFTALGRCEIVSENLIPAITGVSGSGPAYIYTIIEALSDGGVKQGLSREIATAFAAQTVLGSAKMILKTNKSPSELKSEVCSAGGTTIYGIHALEKGGVRAAVMDAVEAAAQRAIELGKVNK